MYPPPADALAQATAQQLDDQFFTSDPYAYIRSRITALLNENATTPGGPVAEEFQRLLGPSFSRYSVIDDRVAKLQVAVDAFALRHQVAETLLRFLHVVLHHKVGASHWVELIDTPFKNEKVCADNHETLTADGTDTDALLRSLLLPAKFARGSGARSASDECGSGERSADELISEALNLHVAWINYAITLLGQKNPDLDAAHNKFKHGMGLRPQDDVLSTMIRTPPDPDGGVPLSALTGDEAMTLFDGITTEYLARTAGSKGGLETTQLVMMPAPTLVEVAAMAHTLALLFHTAATKHFADHEPPRRRTIPEHPGLLVGVPLPGTLRPLRPFALRFPLTSPLRDPSSPDALLFWPNGYVNHVRFSERIDGHIVDDSTASEGGSVNGRGDESDPSADDET